MKVEALNLAHQEILSEKLHHLDVKLSEYSFANLYLFRKIHEYEVIIDSEVFVRGTTRDKQKFLMPIFKPENSHIPLIKSLLENNQLLFPIQEEWIAPFRNDSFELSFNPDDSDYLFRIDKLALYPGRHLSKKRNLVKQLVTEHRVESAPLTKENREEAITVLEFWHQGHLGENDYEACMEALHFLDELHLQGEIFYVDGRPVGFTIGEWINHNCFVIHFDKADKATKGLYQYLLQHFAQSLNNHDAWINLEQDLGSPEIRKAKHSYQPDIIAPKYRIINSKFGMRNSK